jgi:hypothetical protein
MQAPQRLTPAGTLMAHCEQRATGRANRATQVSHRGRVGQAPQTAQRAGQPASQ